MQRSPTTGRASGTCTHAHCDPPGGTLRTALFTCRGRPHVRRSSHTGARRASDAIPPPAAAHRAIRMSATVAIDVTKWHVSHTFAHSSPATRPFIWRRHAAEMGDGLIRGLLLSRINLPLGRIARAAALAATVITTTQPATIASTAIDTAIAPTCCAAPTAAADASHAAAIATTLPSHSHGGDLRRSPRSPLVSEPNSAQCAVESMGAGNDDL